jgi:hypothetical protein
VVSQNFLHLDWPSIIVDDGLLTANQVLRDDCTGCLHTSSRPHISNVIILSVQPERNIQLFPSSGEPIAGLSVGGAREEHSALPQLR